MQIWCKIDLTQSHLRTSSNFFYSLSFSFNRAETSSFAHPVYMYVFFFSFWFHNHYLKLVVAVFPKSNLKLFKEILFGLILRVKKYIGPNRRSPI
jgi:hypothetical protein